MNGYGLWLFVVASYVFIIGGFWAIGAAWGSLYRAQRSASSCSGQRFRRC